MDEQPQSTIEKPPEVSDSTPRNKSLPITVILVAVVLVLIGLYIMFSMNISTRSRSSASSLKYIPYDKVEELANKGYYVALQVYNNRTNPSVTNTYTSRWSNTTERVEVMLLLIVSSDSTGRYFFSAPSMYLIAFKGTSKLMDYTNLSTTNYSLMELLSKEPEIRDGFRVWISGRSVMVSNTEENIVVLANASRIESLSLNYVTDIAVAFAKVLDKENGWTCSDRNLNNLIASVPDEYRNANIILLKNSTDTAIIFTKSSYNPVEDIYNHENYMIITKTLEKLVQSRTHYIVLDSTEKYLLIRTVPIRQSPNTRGQQDVLAIQDAYLTVQHNTDGSITVYLRIGLKNQGDKVVNVKEIKVAPYDANLLTTTITIKPGTTRSLTLLVGTFSGGAVSIWESGTEHLVTVKYDIVGGSRDQVISTRVRAI